jgi:hypothetical protein
MNEANRRRNVDAAESKELKKGTRVCPRGHARNPASEVQQLCLSYFPILPA